MITSDFVYLLLTAFTVSIDSFVCGFSLSFIKGKKLFIVFGIFITVFTMCILTNFLPVLFSNTINEKTASLGGIILVLLGIYNLFSKEKKKTENSNTILKQSVLTGFAVGLDGACANLSLSLMGINSIFVPLIIAVMHGVLISFGIILSKALKIKLENKLHFLPPLILIALGVYKIICFFL